MRRRAHRPLRALLAAGVCLTAACWPRTDAPAAMTASPHAAPSVSLHTAFRPEIPGHSTTVYFRVQIGPPSGGLVPPPLTEVNVDYPAGLDIALSGLGIETCSAATLELMGPRNCPADSLMGEGRAVAEFPVKHEVFSETSPIAIVRTPEQAGNLAMLFCVCNDTPVNTEIIFTGQVLSAARPFGGHLKVQLPLVPSLPEAPDVAVAEINLVLGPGNLTYYERVHGAVLPYRPAGIRLPEHCPRGGYPFAVELGFQDGSRAGRSVAVPCPKRPGRRR